MPDQRPFPRGSATSAIVLLAIAGFATQAMVRVTDSLLPQIAADLNASIGATAIIVTMYLLGHGSVQLVIGPIGDRFGKYFCMATAAAAASVLVALCGLAGSLPQLVAARLGSGLAAGAIIPLALAFVGDVIPYQRRQPVLGRFISGNILGQLFGQAAGGVLGDHFGWRNVFFLLAGLLALSALGLFYELARNPITHASAAPKQSGSGLVDNYRKVLRSPWARALIVFSFLEFGFMFGAFTYVGADLHLRFDVSFTLVGLFVGAFAVGGIMYSLFVGVLVNRLGPSGMAMTGGLLLALAYLTLAFAPTYWTAPAATTAIGLGFYMLHNTLQTNATQMTPEARGTAVAIFSAALYIGQTAGVTAGGAIVDHFTAVPLFVIAAIAMLLLGLWFARELKHRHSETQARVS